MEVGDGRSSSNDLSSAPPSDAESTPGPLTYLTKPHDIHVAGKNGITGAPTGLPQGTAPQPEVKVKRQRKKKDPNAPAEPEKEKKKRAPAKPRATSGTTAPSRKKPKLEPSDQSSTIHIPQSQISTLQSSTLIQPVSFSPSVPHEMRVDNLSKPADSAMSRPDTMLRPHGTPNQGYDYPPPVSTPTVTARSSSMYDPIRSVTIQRTVSTLPPAQTTLHPTQTPPRPTYNPSTSPAISGIIDHPPQPAPSVATIASLVNHSRPEPITHQSNGKVADSPRTTGISSIAEGDAMVLDQPPAKKSAAFKKTPSEAPTRATSPKPARAKEPLPPPPPGSGLLSMSLFGGDSGADANQKDAKGPNIVLHIDLKDPNNRVINFARMAEEKYGFAALYPRQAAQKERLAKVAAAGAALERSASGSKAGGTSAGDSGEEDLSVDIDRDSDNDGDVAMSGLNGQDATNSGTDATEPKRRRRRKVEEYDQDDPFVDDSEMLWEAQAAASKDGFFVYCGPLVPEGEKPAVERADGTIKRGRGRGRGGGPGSRGGRAAASTTEKGAGRTTGAGARGGGVTRKPRITKADRAQMETEKLQREKMATLVAKPAAYPS
ncbi:hypothetical protein PV11_04065 [Exophiala sideris]|uniref:Hpc2-related domain-containing protein n=1 Tax=Exophiala sideris TaxID=1016849 RepID=A0A0D1YGD9_9EURO|nr:hypothetical protein PV11_04065 [Exophiala sideris]